MYKVYLATIFLSSKDTRNRTERHKIRLNAIGK